MIRPAIAVVGIGLLTIALAPAHADTAEQTIVSGLRRASRLSYDDAAAVTPAAIAMFCPWDKS